ncbi:MAG: hypothetical protein ABH832_03750 [bacterium]
MNMEHGPDMEEINAAMKAASENCEGSLNPNLNVTKEEINSAIGLDKISPSKHAQADVIKMAKVRERISADIDEQVQGLDDPGAKPIELSNESTQISGVEADKAA